jgi:hypothetical protein
VDISVGAGVITHDIRHSGRKNPNDETEPPMDIEIRDIFEKEGKHTSPNFPMSVKIGYMF